jgi:hypothetical protein
MNIKKNKTALAGGLNLLASIIFGCFKHAQSISVQDAERRSR